MKVEVKRSAWRMWFMAIGGIPLLVISLDVLTSRNLTNDLREMLFRPDQTQIYEPRDVIWAWGMLLFGVIVVGWGLKELFYPARVVEARPAGLAVRLGRPFKKPSLIPWEQIKDISAIEIEDEDSVLPLLAIEVVTRGDLPSHPWGARWLDERLVGVLAQDWSMKPTEAVEEIEKYALEVAVAQRKARTASVWDES